MNNLLVTICARGGSKGIPGKNLKSIANVPLLAYSVTIGKKFATLNGGHLALSTDSDAIRKLADTYGLRSEYLRPVELAGDTAGKIDTIRHLMLHEEESRGIRYDYILDLDVTAPLRTMADLEGAYRLLQDDPEALNIFSVSKPHRNPYFNVVEKAADGYYRLVKTPEKPVKSRQTAPKVFDLNASFYFYRRNFFEMGFENAYTPKSLIWQVEHICFDLDEPIDYLFMEYLIDNNLLDFNFSESIPEI